MKNEQASTTGPSAQPPSRRRKRGRGPGRLLTLCTAAYGAALLAVTAANLLGPEHWWLGSLNLYMPQWPWALPLALLLPWYLLRALRWSWVPLAMAAWVFGPIMGWSFGLARYFPVPAGTPLRVMTYNVKWGSRGADALLENVAAADPDIILMQDSAGAVDSVLAPLKKPGWYSTRVSQYTILSKYPISDVEHKWLLPEKRFHYFVRCTVDVDGRKVTLIDVHLMTPRYALGSLADNGAEGAGDIQQNARTRLNEARALAKDLETEERPLIVTGDLNAPVQARVCRTLLNCGLRDAFSEAGWGYGYTYGQSTALKRPYVRIDHILVSPEWSVVRCREGQASGSDHSPVIADLVLPGK